jgi:hypothetical protein
MALITAKSFGVDPETARTDNIRGFETELSENKGLLKTTLRDE